MKRIKVKNVYCLVDDEDFEKLNKFKWFLVGGQPKWYVGRTSHSRGVHKSVRIHRVIMDAKKGQEVDHINGNALDNRKSNLRFCTRSQNLQNRVTKSKYGFKGINYQDGKGRVKKWRAYIQVDGKYEHLGNYHTGLEAAWAYDIAASKYFGEFALLNFKGLSFPTILRVLKDMSLDEIAHLLKKVK